VHVAQQMQSRRFAIAAISGRSRGMQPDFRPHETGFSGDCPIHIKINRKGDSMKGHIPAFLVAVCVASLVPTVVPVAQAKAPIKECSASPGKTSGHWSWRLIDGRKCWYAGKMVIAKASLRWSATAPAKTVQTKAPEATPAEVKAGNLTSADIKAAQAKPAPAAAGATAEKRGSPMDAQARMLEDDSFESRWRARVSTD
jgi:hypothetical protein